VFNIGADRPYAVIELAHVVSHSFGVVPEIIFLPPRNEVLHAYASHDKVNEVFGSRTPVPLEVGIGRMATWAKGAGPRSTPEYDGVEVWKNFPAGWESAVKRASPNETEG
jgi:UDP-glucose 4-epimerase